MPDLHNTRRTLAFRQAPSPVEFYAIADALPHMVWVIAPDSSWEYYNHNWNNYTGLTLNQTLGEGWKKVVHPADEAIFDAWEKAKNTLSTYEVEYRIRRHDGVYRWHLSRAIPFRTEDGEILAWFGTCTDIEDQKQNQDRQRFLADTCKLFSESLSTSKTFELLARYCIPLLADCCFVDTITDDGAVRRMNLAHIDPVKEAKLRAYRKKFEPMRNPRHPVLEVARTGKPVMAENFSETFSPVLARNEEELQVLNDLNPRSFLALPLVARDRTLGVISFFYCDDTRKHGNLELELGQELASRAALAIDNSRLFEESEKAVALRDDFLSIASHELKTPLTALLSQIQYLLISANRPQPLSNQRLTEILKKSEADTRRINKLLADLLDVSAIAAGKLRLQLEQVNLSKLVQSVVDSLEGELRLAGCSLKVDLPEDLTVLCDRSRIEQVIMNLLSNALKYGEGKPIAVEVKSQGGQAAIRIRDHGIGIAPENQDRIFGRFERASASPEFAGTGLGLYISRQIMTAHNGEILIESRIGEGSTFSALLPLEGPLRPDNSWKLGLT